MASKKHRQRDAFLHELLHGTYLTISLFERACQSGEHPDYHVFRSRRSLEVVRKHALDALEAFYQAVGAEMAKGGE